MHLQKQQWIVLKYLLNLQKCHALTIFTYRLSKCNRFFFLPEYTSSIVRRKNFRLKRRIWWDEICIVIVIRSENWQSTRLLMRNNSNNACSYVLASSVVIVGEAEAAGREKKEGLMVDSQGRRRRVRDWHVGTCVLDIKSCPMEQNRLAGFAPCLSLLWKAFVSCVPPFHYTISTKNSEKVNTCFRPIISFIKMKSFKKLLCKSALYNLKWYKELGIYKLWTKLERGLINYIIFSNFNKRYNNNYYTSGSLYANLNLSTLRNINCFHGSYLS